MHFATTLIAENYFNKQCFYIGNYSCLLYRLSTFTICIWICIFNFDFPALFSSPQQTRAVWSHTCECVFHFHVFHTACLSCGFPFVNTSVIPPHWHSHCSTFTKCWYSVRPSVERYPLSSRIPFLLYLACTRRVIDFRYHRLDTPLEVDVMVMSLNHKLVFTVLSCLKNPGKLHLCIQRRHVWDYLISRVTGQVLGELFVFLTATKVSSFIRLYV